MAEERETPVRILLLEDSDIDAELLTGHLAKADLPVSIHRVFEKSSFVGALAQQDFDVVVADFSLPTFDGLTALEMTRQKLPDMPFIFVSGLMGEEFATNALRRGATDYILKRNLSRVPTSIERALQDAHQRIERRRAEAALIELNANLEQRVVERTAQLQASEARLRTILETSNQYQGLMTPEGVLLEANMVSLRGIGATLSEVVGKNFWETPWFTGTPGMSDLVRSAISTVAAQGAFHCEMHLNLPEGGWRWFECTIRPLHDQSGAMIALVPELVEFTQRRNAEEALRQSQKMEALGQLTGGIAHDFNNLLTGITGSLDLIRRRMAAGRQDGIERFMDAASTSAQRAAALTHRLLAFARRQSLDTTAQDINQLIGSLEDMLHRTLGENISLDTEFCEGLWPALADGNQLESAILNLTINARDAMPDGGRLTIKTANAAMNKMAAQSAEDITAGDYVLVSVADTGTGMTPDVLEKAFEPFFTTKPIGQGTGLGLSMIYGFVKQSGGFVRLESKPGKGTSVNMYLPRADTVEDVAAGEDQEDTMEGSGETVLVVEDDAAVRLLVAEVLSELGYHYIEVADAMAALPILQSARTIDLLVTDVGLPVMNGRQLAEIARQHRPELKILFMTGYAESAAKRASFLEPGMDMMTKPFPLDALAAKIRQLLGG